MSGYPQADIGCSAQTSRQLWAMGCLTELKAFQLPISLTLWPIAFSCLLFSFNSASYSPSSSAWCFFTLSCFLVYLIFLFPCIENRYLSSHESPNLPCVPIGTTQQRSTLTLESCRQVPSSPPELPHSHSCLAYAFCNKLARGAFADSSLVSPASPQNITHIFHRVTKQPCNKYVSKYIIR